MHPTDGNLYALQRREEEIEAHDAARDARRDAAYAEAINSTPEGWEWSEGRQALRGAFDDAKSNEFDVIVKDEGVFEFASDEPIALTKALTDSIAEACAEAWEWWQMFGDAIDGEVA